MVSSPGAKPQPGACCPPSVVDFSHFHHTGLRSAVVNVSDCKSRGREFDLRPVTFFHDD